MGGSVCIGGEGDSRRAAGRGLAVCVCVGRAAAVGQAVRGGGTPLAGSLGGGLKSTNRGAAAGPPGMCDGEPRDPPFPIASPPQHLQPCVLEHHGHKAQHGRQLHHGHLAVLRHACTQSTVWRKMRGCVGRGGREAPGREVCAGGRSASGSGLIGWPRPSCPRIACGCSKQVDGRPPQEGGPAAASPTATASTPPHSSSRSRLCWEAASSPLTRAIKVRQPLHCTPAEACNWQEKGVGGPGEV